MERLRRYFVTGLAFVVPLALTAWILFQVFLFLDNILGRFVKERLPMLYVPGFGLVALVALVLIVGFVGSNWLGRVLLEAVDRSLARTPVLSKLFVFLKGLTAQVFTRKSRLFRQVVRVRLFDGETYGFVTSVTEESDGSRTMHVLVPTVPNVSSGFYLMVPERDARPAGLSVEEALKVVISAGIFQPCNSAHPDRSGDPREHSVPRDERSP